MEHFDDLLIVACSTHEMNFDNLATLSLIRQDIADESCFHKTHSLTSTDLDILSEFITVVINHPELLESCLGDFDEMHGLLDASNSLLDIFDIEAEFVYLINIIEDKLTTFTVKDRCLNQVVLQLPNSIFFIYR